MIVGTAKRLWKPCEIFILRELISDPSYTLLQIANILNRCEGSASKKSRELGISRCPDKNTRNRYQGIYYDDVNTLNRQGLTVSEIATKLNADEKLISFIHLKLKIRQNYKQLEKKKPGRPITPPSQAKIYTISPDPEPERLFLEKFRIETPKKRINRISRNRRDRDCDTCHSTWSKPCLGNCRWIEKSIQMELTLLPETTDSNTDTQHLKSAPGRPV